MSRYYNYNGLESLEVLNYNRIKKLKENDNVNGSDLRHLLHLEADPNLKENKLNWFVSFGTKWKEEPDVLHANINHFSPTDPTVQMFFSELSKCVEDFGIIVTDEEFPAVDNSYAYSWLLENDSGKLKITELKLIKGEELEDISTLEE